MTKPLVSVHLDGMGLFQGLMSNKNSHWHGWHAVQFESDELRDQAIKIIHSLANPPAFEMWGDLTLGLAPAFEVVNIPVEVKKWDHKPGESFPFTVASVRTMLDGDWAFYADGLWRQDGKYADARPTSWIVSLYFDILTTWTPTDLPGPVISPIEKAWNEWYEAAEPIRGMVSARNAFDAGWTAAKDHNPEQETK